MPDPFPTGAHDAPADAPPTGGYARPTFHGTAHTPTPPADDLPRAFGRYELRNLLGRGGMGAVYLAHDPGLDRLVALKIPRPVEHGPAVWRDRFLAEARAAATLHHPNICPVYEVGEADGRPYLTMAYIPGETLADRLGRAGPLPVPEAVALVRTVARAMAEAHDRGIVHRDLKPANVMIDRRGQPVVMDFGLALRTAASDDLRLTLSGVAMGTPAYMPPEQAGGEHEAIGPPADVYALGVILYQLVTGRVPFRERTFGRLLAQIVRDPPPPPSGFNPAVDPALEAVILTALEKEPGRRLASAGALADALDAYTRGEQPVLVAARGDAADPDGRTTAAYVPGHTPAGPRRRRRGVAVAAGLLGVGLLALLAGVIYVKTDHGELVVELSDPAANVDVRVNGQEVVLDPDGRAVRVRAGVNQRLEVSGPDFETAGESFDLKRGGRTAVRVTLKPRAGAAQAPPVGPAIPPPGPKPEPAKPAPPKPVVFPERSTLVEAPGWQVLTDATQEEMRKWLDARKKDGHSVVWLDAIQVGDKPVFCAAAALDGRAPDWQAFLGVPRPRDSDPMQSLATVVDATTHRLLSLSAYLKDGITHTASLWRPGKARFIVGLDLELIEMDQDVPALLKNGMVARLLRPYLVEKGVVQFALNIERDPGARTAHGHGLTAARFAEFLDRHRKDGLGPVMVSAAPQDGEVLFAATMSDRPARAAWEVDTDLTAQTLGAQAKAQVGRGFAPASVTAYPWDGAVRYAVVWVKEPPKPIEYPTQPTLIESPGWQVLADATQQQMQGWLDDRKRDRHSVVWLDAVQVGDKPVFAAVAALDDRDPKWVAFLDLTDPEMNNANLLNKRLDFRTHLVSSVGGYVRGGGIQAAALFRPGTRQMGLIGVTTMHGAEENASKLGPDGFVVRAVRPFPVGGDQLRCALYLETALGKRPLHGLGWTAAELTAGLEEFRKNGCRPVGLTAYPTPAGLRFAAVFREDPAKAAWEVGHGLTAADLKARTAELAGKGYTPAAVTACPWDGAVRYAAVWVKGPARK